LATAFLGLALAAMAEWNGRETVDVLASASVSNQPKYFDTNPNANGVREFARRIRSTPGKRDDLSWPIAVGEDESPVGRNMASAAVAEQEAPAEPRPFSGYYFKTLPAQGSAAAGGARDYRLKGHLVSGFALVAWPAQYGISGVLTFVTNHSGDVYTRVASALITFSPDHNWKKISSADDENEAVG